MRGKVNRNNERHFAQRITPAYAGKRWSGKSGWGNASDHPRVCGEKDILPQTEILAQGSPPRMRGKVHPLLTECRHSGITPAYAGKSKRNCQQTEQNQDHPRVCGEKEELVVITGAALGSPPRMRGKESKFQPGIPENGITPAYAGKSPMTPTTRTCTWDHPRVCGEKP